ncbi:similar to Saccharomyces cerevisiae YEL043W Predicted cytoskeleton protein involved in intracellular signalling based on quantitative analysis of protein-protein interaction maps [Maudiozyma saulgeensis]|uniref:Similar to Saccharomyces cerevisiae YEL043W Predicted cytoskeleton protein involved in intracellular signalling based on quantitative analysis of protein-protein interaction maps n=1 Tax=Maudiozyma saulgeensis TaxID=1789683 RepID=A0A1X7QXN4_9SACH|nr:similar to Saccharomyces cerevisiae YEL043W Predicted cytoskeleton protein involved in intracellular signalling based on quantitative analysis of protein-protein interaction maps [Kazachstania saulgeensis]
MHFFTACTIAASLWLAYRFYRLMAIPMYKIISDLNIRTPPAIKASVDRITSDSITVHWENEPLDKGTSHISHFILYINNIQLAIFRNDPKLLYTCCLITGLEPHKQYQLDFVTTNELGFVNKLPSLFCMTRSIANENKLEDSTDSLEKPVDLTTPQLPGDDIIGSPSATKTRKWRRNTVSSINQVDTNSDSPVSSHIPSYTNLTKLQDLDNFSIDDLKKILICAQEDLHEILSQQTTAIQDFQENKINLELELENLKSQWSHENDLRKSIKSNIKSLENAKLLSDLKFEKTNQKIDAINSKIDKMKKDIEKWESSEVDSLNVDKLKETYDTLLKETSKEVTSMSKEVDSLQQNITEQEIRNKKLNSLKKSSSSTNLADYANSNNNNNNNSNSQQTGKPVDSHQQSAKLLKKISECISDKTGILNNSGEYYLSKLNQDSPVVLLIKEQLRIDQELEQKWRTKKIRLIKRIKFLEHKFSTASTESRQLKAGVFARTYQQQNDSPSDFVPIVPTTSYNSSTVNATYSNSDLNALASNDASNQSPQYTNTSNNRGINPLLSAFNVPVPNENTSPRMSMDHPMNDDFNMITVSPTINQSPFVNPLQVTSDSAVDNNDSMNVLSSFGRGTATTATTDTIAAPTFPWGSPNQQTQSIKYASSLPKQEYNNNGFEYNDTNHLITGLENMIYDENENADRISNYSKIYTNDQLDNYWTNQKDTSNGSILPLRNTNSLGNTSGTSTGLAFGNDRAQLGNAVPAYTNEMNVPVSSSPLATHASGFISDSQNPSLNLMQPQSLLAATLSDPATMSPFQDNNLTISQSESAFRNTLNNGGSAMDTFLSGGHPLSPHNSQSLAGATQESELLNFSQQPAQPFSPHILIGTPKTTNLDNGFGQLVPENKNSIAEEGSDQSKHGNHDSVFHSPSFNFIWQTTTSPSKSHINKKNGQSPNFLTSPTKPEAKKEHSISSPTKSKRSDSNQTHKRDKSAGSISSWSNRLSLKSRQSITSTVVEDNASEDDKSIDSGAANMAQPTGKKTGSGSSGRRITRLLSKSGMNNLFNLPGHEPQQPTSSM